MSGINVVLTIEVCVN